MFKKMLSFFLLLSVAFSFSLTPVIAEDNTKKNSNSDLRKPIHATNIKIAKKIFDPSAVKRTEKKGKPDKPPGKDKKPSPSYDGVATGVLRAEVTGNKYAIIIGICDYPGNSSLDLCESDGDSLHMYKALINYGYDPANIRLFKDMGGTTGQLLGNKVYNAPTKSNILAAILEIKGLANDPKDEVVFFFSGHGTNGVIDNNNDGEHVDEGIVVHDDDGVIGEDDYDGSALVDIIWDDELKAEFTYFATSRIAFVFDSCLAGGMNDVAGAGRVVSMATDETHSAYVYSTAGEDVDGDGIQDGEGVFSRLFVNKGILQGLADGFNEIKSTDDSVAVEEAFDYAKKNIPGRLKRLQRPVISDEFEDDLLL